MKDTETMEYIKWWDSTSNGQILIFMTQEQHSVLDPLEVAQNIAVSSKTISLQNVRALYNFNIFHAIKY